MKEKPHTENASGWVQRLSAKALELWDYCSSGVWADRRDNWKVNIVKTLNLTVKTFMSSDLQSKACAMTFRTLLAIVPALALLFAIGRGFGFQNLLQNQLFNYFPSQHKALQMAFSFVDSCLAQASEGIFVGVGIVFLLWTLISLLSNVEEVFNQVWGVPDRSMLRKTTDYLAIFIILPILMICSGGLQIFMSTTIQKFLPFDFLSPILEWVLDGVSYVFAWLFFVGAYMLIPNTKVRFKNALVAGIIAGTAFQILQWLFVTGQVYVAKYNAIYGSFSFLPLMLIWMQFSWLITLAGALICCASQNIYMFSFDHQTQNISMSYRRKVCIAILTLIVQRFKSNEPPLNVAEISTRYMIPHRLTGTLIKYMLECGLLTKVLPPNVQDIEDDLPLQPSMSLEHYTVGNVLSIIREHGESGFIPGFDERFSGVCEVCDNIMHEIEKANADVQLCELKTEQQ